MDGRLWPDSSAEGYEFLSNQYPEPYILLGHSNVRFQRIQRNTTFINPGSAGAPYLGHPLVCYALIRDVQVTLEATHHDVEKTCQEMEERARGIVEEDFIEDWKQCWRTGVLPSRYFIRYYTPLREQGYR
jgi:hypothetical protein